MRRSINIQDGVLFHWLKERTSLTFQLVTGQSVSGCVGRFDRYCIAVELASGGEVLLYKHALACIADAALSGRAGASAYRSRATAEPPRRAAVAAGSR